MSSGSLVVKITIFNELSILITLVQNKYSNIFGRLLSLFPRLEFERPVKLTGTEHAAKGFSSWVTRPP
jgi:hypothetical protein